MEFISSIDHGKCHDVEIRIEYDADVNEDFETYEFWGQSGNNRTLEVNGVEVTSVSVKGDHYDDHDTVVLKDGDALPVTDEVIDLAMRHAESNYWLFN